MGNIMDELASYLGFPHSKEDTWEACEQKKRVNLEITQESGAQQ
jgi:hypothetical protein